VIDHGQFIKKAGYRHQLYKDSSASSETSDVLRLRFIQHKHLFQHALQWILFTTTTRGARKPSFSALSASLR
jgi:hypothetical protein